MTKIMREGDPKKDEWFILFGMLLYPFTVVLISNWIKLKVTYHKYLVICD